MKRKHPALLAFGKNIRSRRHQDGLSQAQLAFITDMHRTYIAEIESGTRNTTLLNAITLAKGLGVSLSTLCRGIDD